MEISKVLMDKAALTNFAAMRLKIGDELLNTFKLG
jgi:hypothetical protein